MEEEMNILMKSDEDGGDGEEGDEGADSLGVAQMATTGPFMEAMTTDGHPVQITFNPDTGQYVTQSGEPVVIQVTEDEQNQTTEGEEKGKYESNERVLPDVDETSIAEDEDMTKDQVDSAAEGPSWVMPAKGGDQEIDDNGANQVDLQLPSDVRSIRVVNLPEQAMSEVAQGRRLHIVNPDGEISTGNSIPAPEATMSSQIRIVKMAEGQASVAAAPTQQSPQLRIVSADGTLSSLPTNFRVISTPSGTQGGAKQLRVFQSGVVAEQPHMILSSSGSPLKAVKLTEPQQGGPLSSSSKAPTVRRVVQPATQQQIIRIPTSSLQGGNLQQVQVGGKIQYLKLVGASQVSDKASQFIAVRSGSETSSSLLPSGSVKTIPVSSLAGVRIALPPKSLPPNFKAQRVILPSGSVGHAKQAIRTAMPSDHQVNVKTVRADSSNSGMLKMLEHFAARKEDRNVKPENEIVSSLTSSMAAEAHRYSSHQNVGFEAAATIEAPGVRPRKPCNCTKSQCLKLYCDCFANGEFCNNCNCNNCFNNLEHEEDRQKAIKQCLDRNPSAFKPKIGRLAGDGERRHNKGCNCKRSGCLKNYCECYEAKIPCTDACKCLSCKNVEEETGRKKETDFFRHGHVEIKPSLKSKLAPSLNSSGLDWANRNSYKQPFSFITPEVVEATCQCLLAQAEESERNKLKETEIEGLIIEEFGQCLMQIIDMANKSKSSTSNGKSTSSAPQVDM